MFSVNLSELPPKFQESAYFKSLCSNDNDANDNVDVLQSCTRLVISPITTVVELAHELSTALYWGVEDTSHDIWDAFRQLNPSSTDLLRQLCNMVPNLNKTSMYTELVALRAWITEWYDCNIIYEELNGGTRMYRSVSREMTAGGTRLLNYLVETNIMEVSQPIMTNYAMDGHVECMAFLRKWCKNTDTSPCAFAARFGQANCLKFMHETGWPWDKQTCSFAAEYGHLDCLQYAHEQGCPWDSSTLYVAAEYGRLDCLKYAIERGCLDDAEGPDAMYSAASGGQIECMNYLHELGYSWPLLSAPIYNGHLVCLKYMVDSGCETDGYSCYIAAEYGRLDCLKYLHSLGLTWPGYGGDAMVDIAARNGHLDVLRYLYSQGYRGTVDSVTAACRGGHFKCLRYLLKQRCPYNNDALITAARHDHVRCLRYLWVNNTLGISISKLPVIVMVMAVAIRHKQKKCIQLINKHMPFTCFAALIKQNCSAI